MFSVFIPGTVGGHWRAGGIEAQTTTSDRVATETPRGLQTPRNTTSPRPLDVRATRLLQDNDCQGSGS